MVSNPFCYVDDLISGMIKLMNSRVNTPVNIGNPNQLTILELAEIIEKNQSNLDLFYKPLPQMIHYKQPDIQKAKKLLDWEPIYLLKRALKRLSTGSEM